MRRKHALWLMPEGEARHGLEEMITGLSQRFGTPRFMPHITLLGGLDWPDETLLARASRLASAMSPFTVRLDGLQHSDHYYRCVYYRVKGSLEVAEAGVLAREAFDREDDRPLEPHLSIMYGEVPRALREEVLRQAAAAAGEWPGFEVSSVHLFSTSGEPEQWYRLREFAFPGRSPG